MKSVLLGLSLLLSCCFANAALITYNDYTLDEATNIVTGGGLEWLQWDETRGQSINSALTKYASQGWGVASNVHMAGLFNAFGFGASTPWDDNENTSQTHMTLWNSGDDINSDPIEQFLTLFSISFLYGGDPSLPSDPVDATGAFFGLDTDADGKTNVAELRSDYTVDDYPDYTKVNGYARLLNDTQAGTFGPSEYYGIALVRAIAPANEVSAPANALLMALGLFGLVIRRRHTTWNTKG